MSSTSSALDEGINNIFCEMLFVRFAFVVVRDLSGIPDLVGKIVENF
jgi:hypothetical protein